MHTSFKLKSTKSCGCLAWVYFIFLPAWVHGQNTNIRGFADVLTTYEKNKVSFSLGEQDLFITAQLSDRVTFLGESVFKYDARSGTMFSVSVERIVLKYNLFNNHNLLLGKHHTPINYWNDMYHHGRLFFPTITRPLLFAANIIPLHTTGVSLQGHDLGALKFGYDLMVGNGIGSSEIKDNDKRKSVTLALHIKPVDKLRLGASYYNDVIAKGSVVQDKAIRWKVRQQMLTGSIAFFGNKLEVLTESTFAINKTDTTGTKHTTAAYFYGGYKIKEKIIPYIRIDKLKYQPGEIYFTQDNTTAFVGGIRYQINYLAVVKLEYQYQQSQLLHSSNKVTAQVAIGF